MTGGTVILGIGSPFGDDRIGWAAAEAIRAASWYGALQPRLRVVALDRPGVGLLAEMAHADQAIVIDAMRTGALPGTVRRLVTDDLDAPAPACSGHDVGVIATLHLGRALDLLPRRLALFGIEITAGDAAGAEPNFDPAPPLRAALSSVLALVHEELLASG